MASVEYFLMLLNTIDGQEAVNKRTKLQLLRCKTKNRSGSISASIMDLLSMSALQMKDQTAELDKVKSEKEQILSQYVHTEKDLAKAIEQKDAIHDTVLRQACVLINAKKREISRLREELTALEQQPTTTAAVKTHEKSPVKATKATGRPGRPKKVTKQEEAQKVGDGMARVLSQTSQEVNSADLDFIHVTGTDLKGRMVIHDTDEDEAVSNKKRKSTKRITKASTALAKKAKKHSTSKNIVLSDDTDVSSGGEWEESDGSRDHRDETGSSCEEECSDAEPSPSSSSVHTKHKAAPPMKATTHDLAGSPHAVRTNSTSSTFSNIIPKKAPGALLKSCIMDDDDDDFSNYM